MKRELKVSHVLIIKFTYQHAAAQIPMKRELKEKNKRCRFRIRK